MTTLLCIGTAYAADKNVSISLESNTNRISAGAPIEVEVYLMNPSNYPLTSAIVALQYDPALLEGSTITYGDLPYFDVDIYPGEEQKFRPDGLIRIGRASLSDGTGRDLTKILLAKVVFAAKQDLQSMELKLAEVVGGEDAYVIKMLENGAYVEVESATMATLTLPALRPAAGNRPVTQAATETTTSMDINAALGATNPAATTGISDTSIVPISTTPSTQIVTTTQNTALATSEPDARELATFEEESVPVMEQPQQAATEPVTTPANTTTTQAKLKKAPTTPQSGPMEVMILLGSMGLAWCVRLRSSRSLV